MYISNIGELDNMKCKSVVKRRRCGMQRPRPVVGARSWTAMRRCDSGIYFGGGSHLVSTFLEFSLLKIRKCAISFF